MTPAAPLAFRALLGALAVFHLLLILGLLLSVLPNLASKSKPEKLVMVPLSFLLAALAIAIALS
jgi:hypothetical protein